MKFAFYLVFSTLESEGLPYIYQFHGIILGIVKIKTIGSTYMCASGLNTNTDNDSEVLVFV